MKPIYPDNKWIYNSFGLALDILGVVKATNLFNNPRTRSFYQSLTPWREGHTGIDIPCPEGTPIYAMEDGFITQSEISSINGDNFVKVVYDNIYYKGMKGWFAHYHNSELLVERGDRVKEGDVIALSGNTGMSTGPHTHTAFAPVLDPIEGTDGFPFYRKALYNNFLGYVDPLPLILSNMFELFRNPNQQHEVYAVNVADGIKRHIVNGATLRDGEDELWEIPAEIVVADADAWESWIEKREIALLEQD